MSSIRRRQVVWWAHELMADYAQLLDRHVYQLSAKQPEANLFGVKFCETLGFRLHSSLRRAKRQVQWIQPEWGQMLLPKRGDQADLVILRNTVTLFILFNGKNWNLSNYKILALLLDFALFFSLSVCLYPLMPLPFVSFLVVSSFSRICCFFCSFNSRLCSRSTFFCARSCSAFTFSSASFFACSSTNNWNSQNFFFSLA